MNWVLIVAAAWVAFAAGLAVLIAGIVRLREQHAERERAAEVGTDEPNVVVDLRVAAAGAGTQDHVTAVPTARRAQAAGGPVSAVRRARSSRG